MDPGAFRTEQVEGMAKGRVRCRIQLMSGQRAGRNVGKIYCGITHALRALSCRVVQATYYDPGGLTEPHGLPTVRVAPCRLEEGPRWREIPGPRQVMKDTVTEGPLAQLEGILSGREEMFSLPLPGPLLGSQPLQFCVLWAYSPHSSPCLLPKPAY